MPLDGSGTASTGQPETARLERGRCFLQKAVTGLTHLGRKNVILDRCINYLKQLHSLVDRWGKVLSVCELLIRANVSAADSTSPRTLDIGGLPGAVLDPFSTAVEMEKMDAYPDADLRMRVPRLDGGLPLFDDLELGDYFTTDFQRWL